VLADAYDTVTVVERDRLDAEAGSRPRRGVPQGRHTHALLTAGLDAVEELFPGATAELCAGGSLPGDVLGDIRFHINGHALKKTRLGLVGLSQSRPYLESYVRSRLIALANVEVVDGCDVVGVDASSDRRRVIGARVHHRDAGRARTLPADLVVDATGRGSRTPRWLADLGFPTPVEERIEIDIGYASRRLRLAPGALGDDLAIIVGPTADLPRGGVVESQEHGRALVTLFGMVGDHPPTGDGGFLAFAESLPVPDVAGVIRHAEALDAPVLFRFPASVWRRYDRLRRFPAGLLVVGDAVCCFNPAYGQGMSVVAMEALVLRRQLAGGLDARRFFRGITPIIEVPWRIVAREDLAIPGVVGRHRLTDRAWRPYLDRLHAAAETDAVLSGAFVRVAELIDPPARLLRPGVVARVLRGSRAPAR
jgi:hypothetical protein